MATLHARRNPRKKAAVSAALENRHKQRAGNVLKFKNIAAISNYAATISDNVAMISIYARTIADSVAPISDSVALISDIVAPISNNVVMISNDAAPRSDIVTPLSNAAPAKAIYARPKSNSARPLSDCARLKCHVTLAISETNPERLARHAEAGDTVYPGVGTPVSEPACECLTHAPVRRPALRFLGKLYHDPFAGNRLPCQFSICRRHTASCGCEGKAGSPRARAWRRCVP